MAESKKQLTVVLASQGADKLVTQFKAMQDAAKTLGASIDTSMQNLNVKSNTARQSFKLTVDSAVSLASAIEQINYALKKYPGLTYYDEKHKFKSALTSAKEGQAKTTTTTADKEFAKWYADELKKENSLAKQAAQEQAKAKKDAHQSYVNWWKATLDNQIAVEKEKQKQDLAYVKVWENLLKQKENAEIASAKRIAAEKNALFQTEVRTRSSALSQNVGIASATQTYGADSYQVAKAQAAIQQQAIKTQLAARVQKLQGAFQAGNIGQAGLAASLSDAFSKAERDINKVNSALIEHKKRLDAAAESAKHVKEEHKSFAVRVIESIGLYRIFNTVLNLTEQALLSIPKAGIALEGTTATLTAVFNSAAGAANELSFLTEEAKRTGLPLEQLRKSYANVAASFTMAGESADTTRQIFQDMNTVATTLHLSADRVDAVFLALSQMFNKGKVQAEELTKQLSQTLPGITNQTAKALGLSGAELSTQMQKGLITAHDAVKKIMAQMAQEFGGEAFKKASQGLNAELGRIKTNWTLLAEGVYSLTSGIITDTVRMANGVMEAIQPLINTFKWFKENSDSYKADVLKGLEERAGLMKKPGVTAATTPVMNEQVRTAFEARKIAQRNYEAAVENKEDLTKAQRLLDQATTEYIRAQIDSETKIRETYKKGGEDLADEIAQVSMLVSQAQEDTAATAEQKFLIRHDKLIKNLIKASSEGSAEAAQAYADLMKVYSTVGAKAEAKAAKGGLAEQLRADYSNIKTTSQELVAVTEAELNKLEIAYTDNVIAISDYFAKRKELEAKANTERLRALENEIALANQKNDIDKAASLRLEKINLEIKIESEKTKTLRDQSAAYKDLRSSIADINAEYEKMHGRSGTVYQLSDRFADRKKQLVEQAGSAFSTPEQRMQAVDALRQTKELEDYYAALNKTGTAVDDYASAKERLSLQEERIQNDLKMGAISELDALRQTGSARQEAIAQMENYISVQEEAYKGLPEDSPAVRGLMRMKNEIAALKAEANPFFSKFETVFKQGFADSFTAFADGSKTAGQAFQSFAMSVVAGIQNIIAQEMASMIFKTFLKPLGGSFMDLLPAANGAVFNTPNISKYSGSIVDKPTIIPFAKGGGLIGEAGPEAVLPLKRDKYGKLGVRADASEGKSSGHTIVVNVQSTGKESGDEMGNKIAVQVMKAIAAEEATKAIRQNNYRTGTTKYGR